MCNRNFPLFVNFPRHVPEASKLSLYRCRRFHHWFWNVINSILWRMIKWQPGMRIYRQKMRNQIVANLQAVNCHRSLGYANNSPWSNENNAVRHFYWLDTPQIYPYILLISERVSSSLLLWGASYFFVCAIVFPFIARSIIWTEIWQSARICGLFNATGNRGGLGERDRLDRTGQLEYDCGRGDDDEAAAQAVIL